VIRKGFLLILVVGFSLIVIMGILTALYFYGGKARHLFYYHERIKGYYLCEVGASRALFRLKNGEDISSDYSNPEKFTFSLNGENYTIYYIAKSSPPGKTIHSWVKLPSSKLTYHLEIGGVKQQWPVFIKGYLPPLLD